MTSILIVDDEKNILLILELMLKDMGLSVMTAENGEVAIEKAVMYQPDLIITDVVMPKKNGFEVCQSIRNTPGISDTPIIILSALGDEYNKITGFDEGADDYVTKPFSLDELKARIKAILLRSQSRREKPSLISKPDLQHMPTGNEAFDHALGGGLPTGSNILCIGPLGSGKSSFSRRFLSKALSTYQKALFVAVDDHPQKIKQTLTPLFEKSVSDYEKQGQLRFVDAYSWSSGVSDEKFSLMGSLELNQLSAKIADAGFDIGQTIQEKQGGIRVIDSISSLLTGFPLPQVQRFIHQISRTSLAFGGVVTLFLVEEGTVSEQVLNNIKYGMDGIVEFRRQETGPEMRVALMKWSSFSSHWLPVS